MRIIKKLSVWIIIIVYLSLVTGFVASKHEGLLCNRINVVIKDSTDAWFLSGKDIVRLLDKRGVKYFGLPLSKINLLEVENVVSGNQIVKDCRAYIGDNGSLNIEIVQRQPLVRIIDARGFGYYIDKEGNIETLSTHFSPDVLVVNGNIQTPFKIGKAVNIHNLGSSKESQKFKDIFALAEFISDNKLWNSQIVQVYINHDDEFEMVPRVGSQIILLGSMDDYVEKFEKLEIFYKEGLNNVGWNQYSKINLKYKDQIVCTKI
jgi:cell division protein FtsQ